MLPVFLSDFYFCLQAGFIVKGILVVFPLNFLEKQDPFFPGFTSSPCFPPARRPGSVYCRGEYFMSRAAHPPDHSFTLLPTKHMNKWEETTGEAGCLNACFPQQVNPYLPQRCWFWVDVQMDRMCDDPSCPAQCFNPWGNSWGVKGHDTLSHSFINPQSPARNLLLQDC